MSNLFKLNWQDLVKGLVVTVLSAVLSAMLQSLNGGALDWKAVGLVALSSGLAYLLKNLVSDEQGKVLGKL